jgi:hypothetical protein
VKKRDEEISIAMGNDPGNKNGKKGSAMKEQGQFARR